MKLKLDAAGNVVTQEVDGQKRPVYIKDDGTEVVFDVVGTTQVVARLNQEARDRRKTLEDTQAELTTLKTAFGDIDPVAARKAIDLAKNLDESKLVQAGKVEELKNELNKTWQGKLDEVTKDRDKIRSERDTERLSNQFKGSKFITGKMNSANVAQAMFGGNFKLEDGKLVAYDLNGQKIYSDQNPGELAGFDEAMSKLVNAHPDKDVLLKSDARGGGGTQPGGGNRTPAGGSGKTITRAQFEQLDPVARSKHFADGGSIVDAPAA